jgi:Fe2+ or Zn2+ uptake regulation protein
MFVKRNTVQRQLIFDAVKELNGHVTAEQVFDHIALKYPSISKTTVYRNMSQMAESGELLRIGNFDGSYRYDHNCHDHYHFICERCKRVFDMEDYFFDIYGIIQNRLGFYITSHSITFGGLCLDCKDRD